MPDTTELPPPQPAVMDSTQVGTTTNRAGDTVPVTVVHPAGTPVPATLPQCPPDCPTCAS